MSSPLISVLLPFCNPGVLFEDAIKSILDQKGVTFELILINNNSDGPSSGLAESYAEKFNNIKLIHESKQGISFALNAGLTQCSGNYIARMDADDISLENRLAAQSQFLENNPEFGLVSGKIVVEGCIQNEGMRIYVDQINKLNDKEAIRNFRFIDAPFAHPSVMFRKSLIDKLGPYSTENVPEDFELWLRWFSNEVQMGKISHEVIVWRDHINRLSRSHPNYSGEAFDKVRTKYLVEFIKKNNLSNKPIYIWGGGKLSRKKAGLLIEEGIEINGFIDVNPTRRIQGYSILNFRNIPNPGEVFIISMVSNRHKHEEIFQYLISKDYIPDVDFVISG